MQFLPRITFGLTSGIASLVLAINPVNAATMNLTVRGTDAIYLSGRDDATIPPLGASDPSFPLVRHWYVNPDFLQETFPLAIAATDGQQFSFSASGCVGYGNGIECPTSGVGPDGYEGIFNSTNGLAGISSYNGPVGSLVGLFLSDDNPASGVAPTALDFSSSGLGTNFTDLAPQLGQVFFIGNGTTSDSVFQNFIAPTGVTRLFLGTVDGFGFSGTPGAYEDNDGAFQVVIDSSNVSQVPEPGTTIALVLMNGLFGLSFFRHSPKMRKS